MSKEAQQAVLGAAILEPKWAYEAMNALRPEMFDGAEREVFEKICGMCWDKRGVDAVTLMAELPGRKELIWQMAQAVPSLGRAGDYIRIVQEDYLCASLEKQLAELAYSHGTAPEFLGAVEEAVAKHKGLLDSMGQEGVTSFSEAFAAFSEWLKEEDGPRARTGFSGLDTALGGLMPGTVFTLAARPGGGKTDFAVNLALRMARGGAKVLYFTMEMTTLQLMQRVASSLLKVNSVLIRDKALGRRELAEVERLMGALQDWQKLGFLQEPRVSLQRVRHFADLWKPQVVVIDHIGLMERPNMRDQYKALGLVSNGLKQLALEKGLAVIQLAQMNRQVEARKGEPTLSDLRESGDLEQDSDYVGFLSPQGLEGGSLSGNESADCTLFLKKNRHGRLGRFSFKWQPQYHTFTEVEERYGF